MPRPVPRFYYRKTGRNAGETVAGGIAKSVGIVVGIIVGATGATRRAITITAATIAAINGSIQF